MAQEPKAETAADKGKPAGPRRRRKAQRPAEIVEAGLAEFAAHGFAGTRLEDVAARAGVAKGTIYRYFPDKQALFLAALTSRALPAVGEIEALVDRFEGSTRELFRLMLSVGYARIVDGDIKVLMRVMIAEGDRFPELTAHYHREMIVRGKALLARAVARGIARGEVRRGAAAELPLILFAPALMAALWRMTFDRHEPIATDTFLKAHLDLIEGGLLVPEQQGG